MKNLDGYITEKLVIGKNIIHKKIKVSTRNELRKILEERLSKDKNANFNDLDVSEIIDMGLNGTIGLFENLDPHNIKIDKWDVSNVKYMRCMFYRCSNFNADLSNWDVSNVEDMTSMFYSCKNFNSDLSNWNVSKVEYIDNMFYDCVNFNSNLNKWDVSNFRNMYKMFNGCKSLNKPSWYKN